MRRPAPAWLTACLSLGRIHGMAMLGFGLLCALQSLAAAAQTRQLTPVAAPPEPPFLRIDAEFHTQVVNRFAQDQDGRIIVTASDDKTMRIWKAGDGAPLATLRVPIADGDEGAIYAVAISPDSKTLLAGGYTGVTWDRVFAIYIFDLETGRLRGRLPNLPAAINHLAYAPDGRRFAIAMAGTAGLRLIDAGNGALIASDEGFRERATWVDFDQRGRLVAASFDGDIRLYDADGKRLARRTPVPGAHPYAAAFSPDGRTVAVGYADQPRVELLNAQDLAPKGSLAGRAEQGGLGAVAWARDGGLFAAGSLRGKDGSTLVRHWATVTTKPTDQPGLRDTVFQIAATADGGVLLVGADPALVRLDRAGRTVFRREGPGLDFRDMTNERFAVSADGLAVRLQTKLMAAPWLVDMGQRSVTPLAGTRTLTPVAAPPATAVQVTNWRNSATPRINGQAIRLEREELSRAYAVAPAQNLVVIGTDYQLRVFRDDKQMADAAALPAAAWAVGISGDGRTVVAAVGDGTLRWFSLDAEGRLKPRVMLFLAADGLRWVAWTKEGFFDHSDRGGKQLVGLQLNRARNQTPDWFSFAQVYRLFYSPDTVAGQLHGEDTSRQAVSIDDLRRLLAAAPPPGIDLMALCWAGQRAEECRPIAASSISRGLQSPASAAADITVPANVGSVTLRYRLTADAKGKSAVDLFVNGRNAGRALHDVTKSNEERLDQLAPVEVGLNQLQLRAYDRDQQTYTQSRIVQVARNAPTAAPGQAGLPKPKLFVLSVGINRYPGSINSLNFAVPDARAVAATIKAHAPSGYEAVKVIELYDEKASASAVLGALDTIGDQAGVDDTALIYLSGHGTTVNKRYYFITQNVSSVDHVPETAISESALVKALAGIKAHNGLIFLDTCHAGAFSLDSASQIAHEAGRYVLAASASLEEALDSYDNRNGVFATAVLRGLNGGALSNSKGIVNNFELGLFVTPLVRELAAELHHNQKAQFKIAAEDAQPFPIVELTPSAAAR